MAASHVAATVNAVSPLKTLCERCTRYVRPFVVGVGSFYLRRFVERAAVRLVEDLVREVLRGALRETGRRKPFGTRNSSSELPDE